MSERPEETTETKKSEISGWLTSPKTLKILVITGLVGMALILISSFFDTKPTDTQTAATAADDYAAVMENKLHDMLLCVDGVTECRVLVTLENGNRVVYANGGKEPLTECEPTVRGVVVVVDGFVDETCEMQVKNVVKTALHLAEKRVCVVTNISGEN